MKVIFSPRARDELREIQICIAFDNVAAAARVASMKQRRACQEWQALLDEPPPLLADHDQPGIHMGKNRAWPNPTAGKVADLSVAGGLSRPLTLQS